MASDTISLSQFIRNNTNDGRNIASLLIDVMEGRVEKINVGRRVAAAKELLNRAFGKSRGRDLPKPPRSTAITRSTHKTHQRVAPAQTQAVETAAAASTAVLDKPEQQPEPDTNRGIVIDIDNDPYLSVFDSPLYDFMNECEDPDFDPYLAALDEEYFKSFTGCRDPECEVHGEPPQIDFDPNDYHY